MEPTIRAIWLVGVGVPLLLAALFCQTVTLASGEYGGVLLAALVFATLADVCFVLAFRRGGLVTRWVSMILLLPTLFIIADFLRRAT